MYTCNILIVSLCFSNILLASSSVTGGISPYLYSWSNGESNSSIDSLITGIYTLLVTDSNQCIAQANIEIYEPSQLGLALTTTQLLCYGDSNGIANCIVTGGTPQYSYSWSNGETSQNIENLIGGLYTVTVTDANYCSVIGTVEITSVNQPLELNYSTINNHCFGNNTGSIYTTISGGTPPYQYDWGHNIHDVNLIELHAGTYSLTVSDANNCKIQSVIPITEPSKLTCSLPNDTKVCKNSDFNIQSSTQGGTAPYQFYWNTGNITDNITVNINDSSYYSITVTDANACIATDQINIKTYNMPNLISTANFDTVCPGNPVLISSQINGGAKPYTYTINGDIANISQTVYPNQVNNYITQIVDACGNTASANINIYTYNIPQISISSDVLQGCPPLVVNFNDGSGITNANYNWTFGNNDNNYNNSNNPTHIFDESGIYNVSLEITTKEGCKIQQTINNMITVFSKPEAMFEVNTEVVNFIKPSVDFINLSSENYYNFWYFGDGNMSNETNPYHSFSQIGEYNIMLIVESENGCVDSVKHHIKVKDEFTLYVPTAFSPDGDGINDTFKAVGNGIDTDNFHIAIYDRWGEIIWESNDIEREWNASAKNNNQTVQNGTYKWLIICKDFNGNEHTKSGNVTIIR